MKQPLNNKKSIITGIPISASIIVTIQDSLPYIELRRKTSNHALIKHIITAAFLGVPITIQPVISNPERSIRSLIDKGIIYRGSDEKYYFTI